MNCYSTFTINFPKGKIEFRLKLAELHPETCSTGVIKLFVSDPTTAVGGIFVVNGSCLIAVIRECADVIISPTVSLLLVGSTELSLCTLTPPDQSRCCQAITKIQINQCGEAVITYASMVIVSRRAMGLNI